MPTMIIPPIKAGDLVKTPHGIGTVDKQVFTHSEGRAWLVRMQSGVVGYRSFLEEDMTVILVDHKDGKKVVIKGNPVKVTDTPKLPKVSKRAKPARNQIVVNPRPVKPPADAPEGFIVPNRGDKFRSNKTGEIYRYLQIGSNGKVRLQKEGRIDYGEVTTSNLYKLYTKVE